MLISCSEGGNYLQLRMANQNNLTDVRLLVILFISLFCFRVSHSAVSRYNTDSVHDNPVRKITLSGGDEEFLKRFKRSSSSDADEKKLSITINKLNGTDYHREAYMHWSGNKSDDIFVLTKRRNHFGKTIESKLWVSRDYGEHFEEVFFPSSAIISFYYVSSVVYDQLIFIDTTNKVLYITKDSLKTNHTTNLTFSPDLFILHPTEADWILAYSFNERMVHVSMDFGLTWTLLQNEATSRLFWADKVYDKDKRTVHMEVQNTVGKAHYKACLIPNCTDITHTIDSELEGFDGMSMLVINEYIFIQQTTNSESLMLVSYKRQLFKRAYFPPGFNAKDFLLVNADGGQVFMAVSHYKGVDLYLSDATGRFFVKSLEDVMFLPRPGWLEIDLREINGMPATFIANKRLKDSSLSHFFIAMTFISFDKGGNWSLIPVPTDQKKECSNRDKCHLHLHLDRTNPIIPGLLSEEKAPGLIMAHGNIGMTFMITSEVYTSSDGGWTWKRAPMKGAFKFNILNQGSVMTAISSAPAHTNVVHYSLNDGLTWHNTTFIKDNIRVDGVLNEPGITTLIESVYGHDISGGGWILAKLDFSSVLKQKCTSKDYLTWKPADQFDTGVQCILGQTFQYERKKPQTQCYNGRDYERPTKTTPCPCFKEDFECDYGYKKVEQNCTKQIWFDPEVVLSDCKEGESYNKSHGYRKVAVDKCVGGVETKPPYKKTEQKCPLAAPEGLTLTVDKVVVATGSLLKFKIKQKLGSKLSTNYYIDFNDKQNFTVTGFNHTNNITHTYDKCGNYNVSVTATNTKGKATASVFVRVVDKITDIYVSIPWAVKGGVMMKSEVDVQGKLVTKGTGHVHFVWQFGDEGPGVLPSLTWNRTISHTYTPVTEVFKTFPVSVEAINSVSTVYKMFNIHVYKEAMFVELTFSENVKNFDFESDIVRRITLLQLLRTQIANVLGVGQDRFAVMLHSVKPLTAHVMFVPSTNTEKKTKDADMQTLVQELINMVKNHSLAVGMDGTQDKEHLVQVMAAKVVTGDSTSTDKIRYMSSTDTNNKTNTVTSPGVTLQTSSNTTNNSTDSKKAEAKGANMRPLFIAVPILVAATVVTGLVLMYYKRKFRECRRYSILRQRQDSDHLLDNDDDDEPPLDLNPDFGSGGHRDTDDDHLDLGQGSQLVVTTTGIRDDGSVNC